MIVGTSRGESNSPFNGSLARMSSEVPCQIRIYYGSDVTSTTGKTQNKYECLGYSALFPRLRHREGPPHSPPNRPWFISYSVRPSSPLSHPHYYRKSQHSFLRSRCNSGYCIWCDSSSIQEKSSRPRSVQHQEHSPSRFAAGYTSGERVP